LLHEAIVIQIEGAICDLCQHADLVPEARRAAAPIRRSTAIRTARLSPTLCSTRRRRSNAGAPFVATPPEHGGIHASDRTQNEVRNSQPAPLGKFPSSGNFDRR